jgi:hypothetical protein
MRRTLFFLLVIVAPTLCAAAEGVFLFSGTVLDAATSDPLVAAHVRVIGTSRGTITNTAGRFALHLPAGSSTIAVSMLGYRSDTITISLPPSIERTIRLQQCDIVLPEVVVTSEDPAYEIIRRAIAAKKQWSGKLGSYEFDAFTRQTLRRDTAIASITESYTKGYWQQGDTLREVIIQRRQTENIREEFNFAAVGGIVNFSEDHIRFVGFTFTGPIAPEAFDYYRYKLLRIRTDHGQRLYEILMTPRTRTSPLFNGTIHIADSTYALVGVDIEPNEAFQFPFLKDRQLRYRQQFALYNQTCWLPIDIRLSGAASVSVPGFSIPRIGFDQTSVIYNYVINPQIPDSVFHKPELVVDSSATKIDSTFWAANQVLPLNPEEQTAYKNLDTAQTLDVQFRPRGITIGAGADLKWFGSLLHYADVSFNRVEGFHLGANLEIDRILPWLSLKGGFAYGFSDERTKYRIGGALHPPLGWPISIGGEAYRQVDYRPDRGYYGALLNSATSLFGKSDYRDYFEAEGWRTFVSLPLPHSVSTTLSYISEDHSTVKRNTDFSIFFPSRSYRENPAAADGRLRSLRLDVHVGQNPTLFDVISKDNIDVSIEHADPSVVSSAFAFTRYHLTATAALPTIGQGFLFRPSLRMRVSAGTSAGTLPPQRLFDVESASSGYGPFGVMRGMAVKEFEGTGYMALALEHNFRSLPFLAMDIPFLYENQIELIVYGGLAHVWGRSQLTMVNGQSTIVNQKEKASYAEVGIGIGRILEILRTDFTWRFTDPAGLRFTLGIAQIM